MDRVVLGFSGGVDSTAAAILLQNKGYEVTALYFDVLECGDSASLDRAKAAADKLNITLLSLNRARDFSDSILDYFKTEYSLGRTPIPCVFCNDIFKFETLRQAADEIGAEYIATGHYAKLTEEDGIFYASKSSNFAKDQSYMLQRLEQKTLKRAIFPLGSIDSKDEVRKLVKSNDLGNWDTKDSQDICFIPQGDYKEFLKAHGFKEKRGNFVDTSGKLIGTHSGSYQFTVGQRKGLGIALGRPAFVTEIKAETNEVVIGFEDDLLKTEVYIGNLSFAKYGKTDSLPEEYDGKEFGCKLRYAAKEARCRVFAAEGGAVLKFDLPQRGPTPGQAAALYDGEKVIGGGIIERAER